MASALIGGVALPALIASPAEAAKILRPSSQRLDIGVNKGTLIRLEQDATNIFIANPAVADVQVKSPTLIYVFGVGQGETTLYAMSENDKVLYSATVAVANNVDQLTDMLDAVQPGHQIEVTSMNGMVVLNGFVQQPEEAEEISRLAQNLLGDSQEVINRLKVMSPTQVNLQVKFAEVSRTIVKQVGFNWEAFFGVGGEVFGIATGANAADFVLNDVLGPIRQFNVLNNGTNSIVGSIAESAVDVAFVIDALESEGFVSILAEPNLTAISGETASFLAGGEFPIPIPDEDRLVVEFREFGVGLSFTPIVLANDRINLRVRPEVSSLSQEGAISVNGISVPSLTVRRAETTVELGSGKSFAIAGLLQNTISQDAARTPGLSSIPILGALFKSDRFQNRESELVIIVTPYLVKPVNPDQLKLPNDGYRAPSDIQRYLTGATFKPEPPQGLQHAPGANHIPRGGAGFVIGN
ncbi:MAG: type II and III secretion system protein family protein [Pseudomonadota bacterium]